MKRDQYNLGLTGFPLAHTLSPQIHNAALRELGLEGEYRLYPIPPLAEGSGQLAGLMDRMRSGSLDGLNVTIPHKQTVATLVDERTRTARATGAVNTILRQGQKLIGENTDVAGFLTDLHRQLPHEIDDRLAILIGAGGAARAVAYALLQEDWQVIVAARRLEQAQQFAAAFREQAGTRTVPIEPMEIAELQSEDFRRRLANRADEFTLLVNSTPVGMSPGEAFSPWPDGAAWPQRGLAYDLVYNPQETTWTMAARAAGLRAVGGLGMLVEQAALSFERWTGLNAPRKCMALAANFTNHDYNKESERQDS
jgi:shikimate dehydrogenase